LRAKARIKYRTNPSKKDSIRGEGKKYSPFFSTARNHL